MYRIFLEIGKRWGCFALLARVYVSLTTIDSGGFFGKRVWLTNAVHFSIRLAYHDLTGSLNGGWPSLDALLWLLYNYSDQLSVLFYGQNEKLIIALKKNLWALYSIIIFDNKYKKKLG